MATAVAAAFLAALVTGCHPSGGRIETPLPSPTASMLPADVAATAAASAFAAASLTLPASATEVSILVLDRPPYENVSLTTFHAPQADALAMCEAAGGDTTPSTVVAPVEASMLGDFAPAEGSETCIPPTAANIYINISPEEPALVMVLIYEVPSR